MAEDLVLKEMLGMGFSKAGVVAALRARQGHQNRAIDWLLSNPDAGIVASVHTSHLDPEGIAMLESLGFTRLQAEAGLRVSANVEVAANWLMEHPEAGSDEVGISEIQSSLLGTVEAPVDYSNAQDKGHEFREEAFTCLICRLDGPEELSGPSHCVACQLCVACCASNLVDRCPAVANGGSWHQHALHYSRNDESRCSIRGQHCLRQGPAWVCVEGCGFAICATCCSRSPAGGFRREGRRGHGPWGPEAWRGGEKGSGKGSSASRPPTFHAASAERYAAEQWELHTEENLTSTNEVGAGFIGDPTQPTSDDRRADRLRDGASAVGSVAFATMESAPKLERMLSNESKVALVTFASGAGLPYHPGSWVNAGACKARKDGGGCLHESFIEGSHWSCCGARDVKCHGCAEGTKGTERSVADVTTAEQLLAQGSNAGFDPLQHDEFRAAVAAGELGIAAQFLMAASLRKATGSTAPICPVCAEEVSSSGGLGGAIGCFSGHALHAACAADLALGGSVCPTCRAPLFYAQVDAAEAKAAMTSLEGKSLEVLDTVPESGAFEKQEDRVLEEGDRVRVTNDLEKCRCLQALPGFGGFSDGMENACGNEGEIVQIGDEVEGTRWIEVCSYMTGDTWRWHKDLLTLVERGEREVVDNIADSNVQTSVVQLKRLRAELAWVKRARELLQEEIARVVGIEVPAPTEKPDQDSKVHLKPPVLERVLSRGSRQAVGTLGTTVAPVDMQRARHLLVLAKLWGDDREACEARAALHAAVKAGDLDSVARAVRRRNAVSCMQRLAWVDAVRATSEYCVIPGVRLELLNRPKRGSARSGFILGPLTSFTSTREVVDDAGNLWLKVGSAMKACAAAGCGEEVQNASSGADSSKIVRGGPVRFSHLPRAEGMRVARGRDWDRGDSDGGEGSEGVLLAWNPRETERGWVEIRWQANGSRSAYRAGADGKFDLKYAQAPPLEPPQPQGWLLLRPFGPGTQSVAKVTGGAMRCFDCGGDLMPAALSTCASGNSAAFAPVSASAVKIGEKVLVAATLETVEVVRKIFRQECDNPGDSEKDMAAMLICRFVDGALDDDEFAFRPEDLAWPGAVPAMSTSPVVVGGEEFCPYRGALRSRRELVLMLGSEEAAQSAWTESMTSNTIGGDEPLAMTFASCVRGHLLHARCFQGRLIAGRGCPVCSEQLYVPRVQRNRTNDDDCCGAHAGDTEAALRAVNAAEEELHRQSRHQSRNEERLGENLKMCPVCCAGPLYNADCSDLRAHHGQCPHCSEYPYTPAKIAEMMVKQASSQLIGVNIPHCPKCVCAVIFNGCQSCGYIFADIDWDTLPAWDESAQGRLEAKQRERQAARLLAAQVRQEAALLAHERAALAEARGDTELPSLDTSSMPPPVPAKALPRPRLCGPDCNISHYGRICHVCGQSYDHHDGHYCHDSRRGRWLLNEDESEMLDRRDYDEDDYDEDEEE